MTLTKRPCVVCRTSFSPTSASNVCCSRTCARALRGDFVARFWARVDKKGAVAPGMKTACWLWTGRLEKNGYARIKREDSKQQVSVHRAAWELRHGEVPDGLCVLHKCDVRHCVRHLFLGTHQANTADMLKKGRANKAQGEAHGQSKLSKEQVRAILMGYYALGFTQVELAEKYGVSSMQVSRICSGKRWKKALQSLGTYEFTRRGKRVTVSAT